jgi:putative transposase
LLDAVADRLRGLLSDVAQANRFEILALEIQPDHVHLFSSAPPSIAPSLAIQWFKGISARSLVAEFPPLRRVLRRGHLWAPSFSGGTAGQVSAATIRRSIERAEHVRTRR